LNQSHYFTYRPRTMSQTSPLLSLSALEIGFHYRSHSILLQT